MMLRIFQDADDLLMPSFKPFALPLSALIAFVTVVSFLAA